MLDDCSRWLLAASGWPPSAPGRLLLARQNHYARAKEISLRRIAWADVLTDHIFPWAATASDVGARQGVMMAVVHRWQDMDLAGRHDSCAEAVRRVRPRSSWTSVVFDRGVRAEDGLQDATEGVAKRWASRGKLASSAAPLEHHLCRAFEPCLKHWPPETPGRPRTLRISSVASRYGG